MINYVQDVWKIQKVPMEWKTGYFVKILKEGDLSDCRNWKGIQFLLLLSKAYTRVILGR